VSMSFIAAHTTRIGVGVSALIMPYRNPIGTAKALATLDRMSGGRVIPGIGAGWNEAEFAALGVPFHERGARTTEYLRLWQARWAPDQVSFAGKFVSFADMHVSPKPLQQPHPPIWIGGASDAALRRAARFAAIWKPTPLPVAQLVERRGALRRACEAIEREPIPTRMSFRVEFSAVIGNAPPAGGERPAGYGTPVEVAADLLRYREAAGLDAFQINFHGNRDLDQLLQSRRLPRPPRLEGDTQAADAVIRGPLSAGDAPPRGIEKQRRMIALHPHRPAVGSKGPTPALPLFGRPTRRRGNKVRRTYVEIAGIGQAGSGATP
jgi:probable F420-dependent oxidoreductase